MKGARLGLLWLLLGAGSLGAQFPTGRALSLDEALRLARPASEPVGLARAALTRARGEVYQARSGLLPQITGSASYSRLIKSQFDYAPGTSFQDAARTTYLEAQARDGRRAADLVRERFAARGITFTP